MITPEPAPEPKTKPHLGTRIRMRITHTVLALIVLSALLAAAAAPAVADDVKKAQWNGYEMLQFKVGGRSALLVVPKTPAAGKPWIWRTEFFGHEPQADIALLGKGLHVAYIDVSGLFGARLRSTPWMNTTRTSARPTGCPPKRSWRASAAAACTPTIGPQTSGPGGLHVR